MAADTPTGMTHTGGDNVAISLTGDDSEELRGYWEKLAGGGTVSMPLEKQMWGDEFGVCTDQFGFPWVGTIRQPRRQAHEERPGHAASHSHVVSSTLRPAGA